MTWKALLLYIALTLVLLPIYRTMDRLANAVERIAVQMERR